MNSWTDPAFYFSLSGADFVLEGLYLSYGIVTGSNYHLTAFGADLPGDGLFTSNYLLSSKKSVRSELGINGWSHSGFQVDYLNLLKFPFIQKGNHVSK